MTCSGELLAKQFTSKQYIKEKQTSIQGKLHMCIWTSKHGILRQRKVRTTTKNILEH